MKKLRHIQIAENLWSIFADDVKSAKYRKHYSDASFGDKLKRYAKTVGMKVVYPALLLQYLMKSDDVSLKTKLIISAALGYFILPVDFIPDFAPLIGFADDLGVLLLVLRQIASSITPEIRKNAREHLQKWFGAIDAEQLDQFDKEYSA
ncbi:MAG TPA: YkvA family protein [Prolixibacteraceae bacterium]|nr:YkvA family protein [Prolixibacteraceae bacterium]